jgi:hypothetical protein
MQQFPVPASKVKKLHARHKKTCRHTPTSRDARKIVGRRRGIARPVDGSPMRADGAARLFVRVQAVHHTGISPSGAIVRRFIFGVNHFSFRAPNSERGVDRAPGDETRRRGIFLAATLGLRIGGTELEG